MADIYDKTASSIKQWSSFRGNTKNSKNNFFVTTKMKRKASDLIRKIQKL